VGAPDEIEIVPYDPTWPRKYEEGRTEILAALGGTVSCIDHIGSTAVPGLDAKPIIDIMLGLRIFPPAPNHIASLQGLGYEYLGEYGIPNRHFFRKGMPRSHHLHVVRPESQFWKSHVAFRDLLRAQPALRRDYVSLKLKLALQFRRDPEGYADAKGDFIRRALARALE
jgi:GrpB-like predicted nucleotidyltransferase (UPF0157 family)